MSSTGKILLVLLAAGCATPAGGRSYEIVAFQKRVLTAKFHAEGASFADFDRDGAMDVVAGPYWYPGPDFRERHEYYPAREFDPLRYSDSFFAFPHDFDGDGWTDVLVAKGAGEGATWYRNPGAAGAHWTPHAVLEDVGNESPAWTDLTGDGRPELVYVSGGHYGYAGMDPADPTRPWRFRAISPKGGWQIYTHGLGIGDVDGDGRQDVLEKDGWWEQPASLQGDPVWNFHPFAFAVEGGAQMYAYDLDGDGDADVVTSLNAHGYGLAWFEQVRIGTGISFVRHLVMNERPEENAYGVKFSQPHALALVDIDGDGVRDVVTGKRYWAHGPAKDPEPNAAAVIYWFRTVRAGPDGGVELVPHLVDDDSGVGVQLVAGDVTGDGLPDLVSSNKKGTIVLIQERRKVGRAEWEAAQPRRTGTSNPGDR